MFYLIFLWIELYDKLLIFSTRSPGNTTALLETSRCSSPVPISGVNQPFPNRKCWADDTPCTTVERRRIQPSCSHRSAEVALDRIRVTLRGVSRNRIKDSGEYNDHERDKAGSMLHQTAAASRCGREIRPRRTPHT